MKLSEFDLEDLIWNDLLGNDGLFLKRNGLSISSLNYPDCHVTWQRQLDITPYGILDIAGFYRLQNTIVVDLMELKITEIDANHFEQVSRYQKGLEVYLKNTFSYSNPQIVINRILIGSSYNGLYLQNTVGIDVYTYDFSVSGLTFELTKAYAGWHHISGKDKSFKRRG